MIRVQIPQTVVSVLVSIWAFLHKLKTICHKHIIAFKSTTPIPPAPQKGCMSSMVCS